MSEGTDKFTLSRVLSQRRQGQHMSEEERKQTQRLFLESLCRAGNITAACLEAHISRQTIYDWQEKDEEFGLKFQAAQAVANDVLYREAWRRAVEGAEEPVISMGKLVRGDDGQPLTTRKYSDQLLMFVMRARMPEFREKQQIEHSGAIEHPASSSRITLDTHNMTSEQAQRLMELALEMKRSET